MIELNSDEIFYLVASIFLICYEINYMYEEVMEMIQMKEDRKCDLCGNIEDELIECNVCFDKICDDCYICCNNCGNEMCEDCGNEDQLCDECAEDEEE